MKTRSDILFGALCAVIVVWFLAQRIQREVSERRWEKERQERILIDFSKTKEDVMEEISRYIPDVNDSMMLAWEQAGKLEFIDTPEGKRYFRRTAANLFRTDTSLFRIKNPEGYRMEGYEADDSENVPAIMRDVLALEKGGFDHPEFAQPKRFRVTYTLTVDPDAVPEGETIRCWLPYPRSDTPRQKDIILIGTDPETHVFSPSGAPHSTVYLEKKAEKGKGTVFSETFEYTSFGEWHNLSPEDVKPYDKTRSEYKINTSERNQHIRFTPALRALAEKITQGIDNPLLQARAIFTYINDNYPWAGAREYSTIPDIPSYVIENGHGDCGQVGLLLITLCRIKGIPAKWESGFMMHPQGWNLHDWAEIYFEGIGWVPADVSFGIPPYALRESPLQGIWAPDDPTVNIPGTEFFFLGGIDSYRMVVNNDYSGGLYPKKKYPRSETVDFQRGEVEWKGGNLYFPKWDYHMDIEYLPES